jgi:sialidase-1
MPASALTRQRWAVLICLLLAFFVPEQAIAQSNPDFWSTGPLRQILDTVVCRASPQYARFSEASLVAFDENHIFMAVSAFYSHYPAGWFDGSGDFQAGRILGLRSYDGGLTWTPVEKAQVLLDNIGAVNTIIPSVVHLGNGKLVMFFWAVNSRSAASAYLARSEDWGVSWSKLQVLDNEGYAGPTPGRAIRLKSGRILVPMMISKSFPQPGGAKNLAKAYCWYSDDNAKTWEKSDLVGFDDDSVTEPGAVELKDGTVMMIVRSTKKSIYKSISTNGGKTWGTLRSTGIPSPNSMAEIRRMPNGDLLLVWNYAPPDRIEGSFPRQWMSTAISKDEGVTWSHVRHLEGGEDFEGKLMNPTTCFPKSDRAIIVYSKSPNRRVMYDLRYHLLTLDWFYGGANKIKYPAD